MTEVGLLSRQILTVPVVLLSGSVISLRLPPAADRLPLIDIIVLKIKKINSRLQFNILDGIHLKRIGQDVEWYFIKGSDGGDHTQDENKQDHSEHKSHMATEKSPWKYFLIYFVLLIMKDRLPRGPQSMPPIA